MDVENWMHQIEPQLFLGNMRAAESLDLLTKHEITHILIAGSGLKKHFHGLFEYEQIFIEDFSNEDILQHFPKCLDFIANAVSKNGKVFVHCAAGMSRSPTIVIAYLMYKNRMTRDEALAWVQQRREIASPNFGFLAQLKVFEEMECNLQNLQEHPKYIQYLKTSQKPMMLLDWIDETS